MAREVNAVSLGEVVPAFLKWSKTMITFDRKDHPNHIPQPGHFPLVMDPIIGKTCLSRVLMDSGSDLNLLYAETYDAMGLLRAAIWPYGAPFHGVYRYKNASTHEQAKRVCSMELEICLAST